MSLQIWLPLNGDLHNQGLGKITSISGTPSYKTFGKLSANALNLKTRITFVCPQLANLQTFSIAFWAIVQNSDTLTSSWQDVLGFTDVSSGGTNGTFRWETTYSSSNLGIHWHDNATNALVNGSHNHITVKEKWVHCCVVFNNITQKIYSYDNGILTQTHTHANGRFNSTGTFYIGETNNIEGMIQDVRIYNHALSNKEVKEISKGLILHYQLNNNGMGNPNILTGTYYNSYGSGLAAASTARNIDGKWAAGSGGNGKFSVTEDLSCPIGKYSWNVLNNTSGNRDFQQGDQPYVSGQIYTTSFWAKGSGTCLYRSWNSTDGKQMFSKTWTLTENWTYYTYTFTASAEMETDSCTFHLGVTGASSISICGMKMEKGNKATPYCTAIGELIPENIIYDSSGYNNNSTTVGTINLITNPPIYNIATNMNNTGTENHIESINDIIISNDAITVSAWIKAISKATNQVYFTLSNIQFGTLSSLGYINPSAMAGFTLNNFINDAWNHIVVIRTGSTFQLYVNGIAETQSGANNNYIHNVSKLWLLNRSYNNNYAANATISDVRIYATALSAEDILNLYKTSKIINGTNKVPRDLE